MKQIKKLKQRVAALEAKPDPASLPPSGSAGGDLTGTYPDPDVVSSIARDNEIFPAVLANDGTGSNLDADKLDGFDSADYGAVLLGRLKGLDEFSTSAQYGAPSGISTAAGFEAGFAAVSAVTPNHDLMARDLSVQLTAPPGSGAGWTLLVKVGMDPALVCVIEDTDDSCTASGPGAVPANSTIAFGAIASPSIPADAEIRFAFRLTP